MRIVHEGRGGYIELDGQRYPIEHVEGGRFCVYFPEDQRSPKYVDHLEALERLVGEQPEKWALETRSRLRRR